MSEPPIWSLPRDLQLRRMRTEGANWDEIAAELRISRWSAIERGRRFAARENVAIAGEPTMPDLGREPLPAGHRASWGALTAATTLYGQGYPWPPLSYEG